MQNIHHQLQDHRKKNFITQKDVAYLLNFKNSVNISRSETGDRPPTIDIILAYHLLFDTQLGSLFADRRNTIKSRIVSRINPLIARIEKEEANPINQARIASLKEIIARLNHDLS
jgi:transcriptional regulator with XRE-family HTH domain